MKKSIYCLILMPAFIFTIDAHALTQNPPQANRPYAIGDTVDGIVLYEVASMRKKDEFHLRMDLLDPSGRFTPSTLDFAQTYSATTPEQGNLYQLTQNIYASFLLYKTWSDILENAPPYGRVAYVVGIENDELRVYLPDSLKTIPLDAVESIEWTDDPFEGKLFAPFLATCLIKVRLKDKELYEAVTKPYLKKWPEAREEMRKAMIGTPEL